MKAGALQILGAHAFLQNQVEPLPANATSTFQLSLLSTSTTFVDIALVTLHHQPACNISIAIENLIRHHSLTHSHQPALLSSRCVPLSSLCWPSQPLSSDRKPLKSVTVCALLCSLKFQTNLHTGQVQVPAYGSPTSTPSAPPATSEAPVTSTPPPETSAVPVPPVYGGSSETPVVPPPSSPVSPIPSYPATNATTPVTTGGPVTSGQPTLPTYGGTTPSETEIGPIGTGASSAPTIPASPNGAGMVSVQMGLAGVALAGLVAALG